jgi:hypothetical protein
MNGPLSSTWPEVGWRVSRQSNASGREKEVDGKRCKKKYVARIKEPEGRKLGGMKEGSCGFFTFFSFFSSSASRCEGQARLCALR